MRKDRVLATIVLSSEPPSLYFLEDPQDPSAAWKVIAGEFRKKTWANKLALRCKLDSLRLKDGDLIEKLAKMTETFDGQSVINDPVQEEDRLVHLLSSFPDSYDILVTALEANMEVSKVEIVTEHLLHYEQKLKERSGSETNDEMKGMVVEQQSRGKGPNYHYCGIFRHIKPYNRKLNTQNLNFDKKFKENLDNKYLAYNVAQM